MIAMRFGVPASTGIPAAIRVAIRPLAPACVVLVFTTSSCRRPVEVAATTPETVSPIAVASNEVLSFPAELRSDNEAVNEFVTRSMKVSAAGDYDAFRRLWSVLDEPISQQEFMEGWRAVREIRVKALRKVRLTHDGSALGTRTRPATSDGDRDQAHGSGSSPEPQTSVPAEPTGSGEISQIAYALFAEVTFDPARTSAARENPRQLALLVVPEQDQWRLARPPKQMKPWIREQLAVLSSGAVPSTPPTAGHADPGKGP